MINDKILELMNRELDNANSKQESAELQTYLKDNPEAQKHYNTLIEMNNSLDTIPDVPPPADMKMNIMNSIDPNKYAKKATQPGFFVMLKEFFTIRPRLQVATTFAVGAAFGLALFAVSDKYTGAGPPLDQSHLSGTLILEDELDNYTVIESKTIETEYVSGTFELKRSDIFLIADITLNSKVPAVIKLGIDNNHTVFKGFNQAAYTYSGVHITDTEITWEHFGNNRFIINLEDISIKESVVRLSIHSDQENIEESITTLLPIK